MAELKDIFFPHSKIRETQDELIRDICQVLEEKKNLIVHAPTGLGKTAAAISPALSFSLKKDLSVFFLTSRHTQHMIAIETLKDIKKKYDIEFTVADIIGKKWMCCVEGIEALYSGEFADYCKSVREEGKCEFYSNTKKNNKVSVEAKRTLEEIQQKGPLHCEQVIEMCKKEELCPYEISVMLAQKAKVIVADYYYIFNPAVRDGFFAKANKELEKSIVIIDEGHNLPSRARELLTQKLSSIILVRAIKEGKKFGYSEIVEKLSIVLDAVNGLSDDLDSRRFEKLVKKDEFAGKLKESLDYEALASDLITAGDDIRESQKKSYIGSIGKFLEGWQGSDEGFVRIISKIESGKNPSITLSYRCLDPSLITKSIFETAHSSIIMSGTLNPTSMYKDILRFENVVERNFASPFPKKNKLAIIVPETTTKYSFRSESQFKDIARVLGRITDAVPGNSAVFFPSYALRNSVNRYFSAISGKTVFLEDSRLNKKEKKDLLDRFKRYKDSGAVLLGTASGSFGEGIDLPGDLLKCVVAVGLPLLPPDLETKELIRYYDDKFGKGWDYGYIFPAFIKSLQNAGRCIRSEKDKGVMVFLDQRYALQNYIRCFPKDMEIKVSRDYIKEIEGFFGNN